MESELKSQKNRHRTRRLSQHSFTEYNIDTATYSKEFWQNNDVKNLVKFLSKSKELGSHGVPYDLPYLNMGDRIKHVKFEFLIPFVKYYFRRFGNKLSKNKFKCAFESATQYLPDLPKNIQKFVMLIEGIQLNNREKLETPDFVIRQMNFEEASLLRGYSSRYKNLSTDEMIKSVWVIDILMAKEPDVFVGDSDWGVILDGYVSPDEMGRNIILFLRLCTGLNVYSAGILSYGVMDKGSISMSGLYEHRLILEKDIHTLSPTISDLLTEKWLLFETKESERQSHFRVSIDRFMKTYGESKADDKIIDEFIGLESLFEVGRISPKKTAIAERYLKKFPDDPDPSFSYDLIIDGYDVRNTIVHGARIKERELKIGARTMNIWELERDINWILRKSLAREILEI